ncbi:MAG: class I SAM-dependent methyltransferase [Actinomycetota bacterium]|nr:class I SAM-dependent methyltransferase [Actinomycetota bacterium]
MNEADQAWDGIAEWWIAEVAGDPVYREDVGPILDRLLIDVPEPILDLGCGEGQWLRRFDAHAGVFGTDGSHLLLTKAHETAPVVRSVLPELTWVRSGAIGTAISLFVLDLIKDHVKFFNEAARIVAPAGSLVVIINHPAFTAPGSGPFMDPEFDVFWRWGSYLDVGSSGVPAGSGNVVMHHRPVAELLTSAARSGWILEEMIEAPLGSAAIEREPSYVGQEGIPRFLGVRWRRWANRTFRRLAGERSATVSRRPSVTANLVVCE